MGRAVNRTLAWAIAFSILLHLLTLGTVGLFNLNLPVGETTAIEARLVLPPAKPHPPPPVETRSATRQHTEHAQQPIPVPSPEATEPASTPEIAEDTDRLPEPGPAPAQPASPTAAQEKPTPILVARPAVRDLPDDLKLNYAVLLSDDDQGFVAGRAAYIWHSGQGRYSLVSTLEASGLTALFVHGRVVQVSQGQIDQGGLVPEQYWMEKSGKKRQSARFDWAANRLLLDDGQPSKRIDPGAQDLLSFPFQFAMTIREDEPDFMLWVTDGRRFRDYNVHVIGHETIKIKDQSMSTVHIQCSRKGDGTLDVWLDLDRSGLPVRIRTQDEKGKTMMLRLDGASQKTETGSGG